MLTLRQARAHKMLTIRELAQLSGVSKNTVDAVERGARRPYLNTAALISQALGLPPNEIQEFREVIDLTANGRGSHSVTVD